MELTKQYYIISEVADMFGVKTSKIRYWESQFPHLSPKRKASGTRKYTQEDIHKIKLLVELIDEKGLTIEGAKLAINKKGVPKNENQSMINQLTEIRDFLQVLKDNI